MKRKSLVLMVVFVVVGGLAKCALAEGLPDWVNRNCQKVGDIWLFSGSVHEMSLLNVAVPLARSSALSNMATSIGVAVNSAVTQKIEGSEIDGYTEGISVSHGYILDRIVAYGVRQKEQIIERVNDPLSGRTKFNVHILLEVSDIDLQRAKSDFAKRAVMQNLKPVMRSKSEKENAENAKKSGFITRLVNLLGI